MFLLVPDGGSSNELQIIFSQASRGQDDRELFFLFFAGGGDFSQYVGLMVY